MQEQYDRIRGEYPDALILFRLGDFYEVFENDAVKASQILGITLTSRGKGEGAKKMAGVPHHALKNYLPKLIEAGFKVAIADQVEEPKPGKLVERQVTKIITPGTVLDESSLDGSKHNFIASVYRLESSKQNTYSVSYADISTGTLVGFEVATKSALLNELEKLSLSELVISETLYDMFERSCLARRIEVRPLDEYMVSLNYDVLTEHFGTKNLKGFGLEDREGLIVATGRLVAYAKETQKNDLAHMRGFTLLQQGSTMNLDFETVRNLELLQPLLEQNTKYSLLGTLDQCMTPMGKRLMRLRIVRPSLDKTELERRYDFVDKFVLSPITLSNVRDSLKGISDIERITARIASGSAHAKELMALAHNLNAGKEIIRKVQGEFSLNLAEASLLDSMGKVSESITKTLKDEPSVLLSEGNLIREGFDPEVDELRTLRNNISNVLKDLQHRESEQTGIPSLKVSFNKVFGYYIEVTRTHSDKVPAHFVRKQTLANAERYITDELKQLEEKILKSEESLITLERNLFLELRDSLLPSITEFLKFAKVISEIDVHTSFAFTAREFRYTRPEIVTDQEIVIKNGRHPVVERLVSEFIPNSTNFDSDGLVHILTGPNMAGKSTYIRQVALITLMAQIGSFVPAEEMTFGIVDRIFTRVGASDNLAKGESTFMVEMQETANILNNATDKSLVILDEVGRGTSTYDGVAIAWSVVEHLLEEISCKALFATHYHELTAIPESHSAASNFNVAVKDDENGIVFLHKIKEGGTSKSYGVHVAGLAGVPETVVNRANEILKGFESVSAETGNDASKLASKENKDDGESRNTKKSVPRAPKKMHPEQLGLIDT